MGGQRWSRISIQSKGMKNCWKSVREGLRMPSVVLHFCSGACCLTRGSRMAMQAEECKHKLISAMEYSMIKLERKNLQSQKSSSVLTVFYPPISWVCHVSGIWIPVCHLPCQACRDCPRKHQSHVVGPFPIGQSRTSPGE